MTFRAYSNVICLAEEARGQRRAGDQPARMQFIDWSAAPAPSDPSARAVHDEPEFLTEDALTRRVRP
jgi:hypothetical protein